MDYDKMKPSHDVFVVTGEDKARWLRIGSAYPEEDGNGYRLSFDAAPARNGRLVLREFNTKARTQQEDSREPGSNRNPDADPTLIPF